MITASRMGLWLGAAAVVGAGALAATSTPRREQAPAATPPEVKSALALPAAAPVAVVPAAKPAAKKAIKRTPVAPSKPAPAHASVIDPATPAHSAGMVIQIDPETGLIGPGTADATLETDPNFEGDGLVKVVMPDGSIMMDLEGRFQMYSTVTMGADGKPVFQCSPKPHPAHKSCAFPAQTVEE